MMLQAEIKDGGLPDEASLEGGHGMLIEQVRIWKAEWKAEKEREWKQEGTRETLVALARDRFGGIAATALPAKLSRISSSESLGEIRRLLLNCDSAEALLGQIEAV